MRRAVAFSVSLSRIHNLPDYKATRKKLRNQATPTEVILWHYLRKRIFFGLKFRRQHSIGKYIVDFYCMSLLLAIEVDGGGHWNSQQATKDYARQRWIESQNILVVRFKINYITFNIEGVLLKLEKVTRVRAATFNHPLFPS